MKKFLKALVSIMLIFATGCSSKTVKTSNSTKESSAKTFDGNYYNMINNGRSKNSEKFYLNFSNTKDLVTIGSGLQILSTKHFSTNDYYLSEGLQLTPTDYNNLLKRDAAGTKEEDKKYPDTLQIESGKTYEGLQSPVLVSNITEQDYYKKSGSSYALKGISVAIILDPKEQIDGKLSSPAVTLSDEKLRSYAQQCVKKTYKYIRSKKKKLADVPVMIGIYRANNNEISEKGWTKVRTSNGKIGYVKSNKLVNEVVARQDMEEEKQILESLSSDFTAIYYLEVNSGKFESVHIQDETNASELIRSYSGYKDFYEYAYQYAMRYIPKEEQPEFLWWFSRDNLKSLLKTQVSLTQNYRCNPNAQNQQYFETKVVKVSEDEESCHALLGFRYIDDIIKKEKATQKRLQDALDETKRSNETISTIAKSYSSIYQIDLETDTYERISGSEIIPKTGCASQRMYEACEQEVAPEYRNIIHQFVDIKTLASRLEKEEDILAEYRMADGNWHKLRYIVRKRDADGKAIQAIATIRTISETKRKELNLFFEAEQAKRETKIKTRFLQSMSHDMRTPLNGIAGMLHIADQNPKNLELQKTTRNKVHQSLNYLISLVNDVLDMNDLESDHFTEEEVDFDITELLGNMNIDAQQLAQEKNIQYILDCLDYTTYIVS